MSNPFVEANLPQNSTLRVNEALERLKALIEEKFGTTWLIKPADLSVIQIEVLGSLVGNVELTAATVLAAVFRRFGTKLLGLPYNEGARAKGTTTWAFSNAPATTIPAGTQLEASEVGFETSQDVTIEAGQATASIPIVAVAVGTEYNAITGIMTPTEPFTFVTGVTLSGETTEGANQETDEEYEGRLTDELELQAPRPITAGDFAKFTLGIPSTVLPTGVVVGRATSIDGYSPAATSLTATTSSTSTTLSEVSSFTGVTVGSVLSGAGIPTGATVTSINTGAKTLVMSSAATGTHSKEAVTSTGSYENGKVVTTWVADDEGKKLSSEAMEAIERWLKGYRELNFLPYVRAPLYQKIYITYTVVVLPGWNGEAVIESIDAALEKYLSPFLWANPNGATNAAGKSEWLTEGYEKIRYNVLLGVIENVRGVQYVPHGSSGLAIGFSSAPEGTEDLTLTDGPVVLPEVSPETISGSVV